MPVPPCLLRASMLPVPPCRHGSDEHPAAMQDLEKQKDIPAPPWSPTSPTSVRRRSRAASYASNLSEHEQNARRTSGLGLHRTGGKSLKSHQIDRKMHSDFGAIIDLDTLCDAYKHTGMTREKTIDEIMQVYEKTIAKDGGSSESTAPDSVPTSLTTPLLIEKKSSRLNVHDSSVPMEDVVKQACDVLPNQAVLENFVHRNPWEGFQSMSFHDAHVHMRQLQSYLSPGERFARIVHTDPRTRVNTALAELCAVFMDLGVAKWEAPDRDKGFMYFFASLESLGCAPWRQYARTAARRWLDDLPAYLYPSENLAHVTLQENLRCFGIPPKEYIAATRSMLLDLPGWAGMFKRMEAAPDETPASAVVRLCDFCAVQSTLLRSSMEALASQAGWGGSTPIATLLSKTNFKAEKPNEDEGEAEEPLQNPSGLAFLDQNAAKREELEEDFEITTLGAIGKKPKNEPQREANDGRPILQVYTCIDEREESFRRHLEEATGDPSEIETFGIAGFFGLPITYEAKFAQHEKIILAPPGNNPPHCLSEEVPQKEHRALVRFMKRRRFLARIGMAWENASFSPAWSMLLAILFPISILRLIFMCFFPNTTRVLMRVFYERFVREPATDFRNPFTAAEAAKTLAATLGNVGQTGGSRFAPIVVVLGHGSRTVSNPFDAAHNCGACGGREGGPNARLMARCANDKEVRTILAETYNIHIPEDTWYIGGYHDTTSDLVEIFDLDLIPSSHVGHYSRALKIINDARGKNALERCEKFCHAIKVRTPYQALRHVETRSTDLAQARPECGHATNAAVIIGRRPLTKGHDFARRLFLPSYDPFNDDDNGTHLERVLTPALVVCSGISLEYYFSTIDGGAGTKVPVNIVGNFGVMQGTSGDLLIGLPTQMTELHSPVRALFLVDAPVNRVTAVLSRNKVLHDLVYNEWVRFFVRDPNTNQIYMQMNGQYIPVDYEDTVEQPFVPFEPHHNYALQTYRRERFYTFVSFLIMILSCTLPVYYQGLEALAPRALPAVIVATVFAVFALGFSARYLHGEFMFDRFVLLFALKLAGFNIIATATNLKHVLVGWNMIGLCSVFLIGIYNDRPTVGENATFVCFIYQLSDAAMLVAAAFSGYTVGDTITETSIQDTPHMIAAIGLLVAALIKSSQFPFMDLLARAMEGPMPSSALGYGALSSHVGIVLLANMKPMWFGFMWARIVLASFGLATAVLASFVAKILADRKGAIAYSTAATIGVIMIVLASGQEDLALVLALGNASARMIQVLRSANLILDHHNLKCALGHEPKPVYVSSWLFKVCWTLKRLNSDVHLPRLLQVLSRRLCGAQPLGLGKFQQWMVTAVLLIFIGLPFTPVEEYKDTMVIKMLHYSPVQAGAWIIGSVVLSVVLTWLIFFNVLDPKRFLHKSLEN